MKNLILIFFILPLCLKAQVYKAGDTLASYIDVNPDTLLNIIHPYSLENYSFDISNDLQNDFKIEAYNSGGLSISTTYIEIIPLNSNSFVRYGRTDSLYNNVFSPFWQTADMAKPLFYGDSINSVTPNWKSQALSITNNSGATSIYLYSSDFVSPSDLYIPIKYESITDTIFGWIRVNCPNLFQCYLKDYSYTGASVGVKEFQQKNIAIFPNPTTHVLHISDEVHNFQNSNIEITNYLGQTVLTQNYADAVDVSKLSTGIYTLKILTSNKGIMYSKFIKE